MSDDLSSPELPQVEPDLGRRVAWGLIAGRSKAEIALAENLTEEECRAVCVAPGMFAILNVWVNFLARRREAGKRNVRKLAGWAIEHIFTHAPERLSKSELWRLDRLSNVMLDYGFGIVFGWFLKHLDGVMGLPGAERADLCPFRQNLVDLVAWAIETTLHDKLKEQFPAEYLAAKDLAFRRAIADREMPELGLNQDLRTIEDVVAEYEAMAAAESAEAEVETTAEIAVTAGADCRPRVSRRPASFARNCRRRLLGRPRCTTFRPPSVARGSIRPPPRYGPDIARPGRCSPPLAVRPVPMGRAA